MEIEVEEKTLLFGDETLLVGLAETMTVEKDPLGVGVFVKFRAEKPLAKHVFPVGDLPALARFTACHRYEPYWMKPAAGTRGGEVPIETQVLLYETEAETCVLMVPLLDGAFRAALQGVGEAGLELVAETGDPATVGTEVVGLFVAAGQNPYALMPQAAQSVMRRMGTGRLRNEKQPPEFLDWFGWCTWDSFYQEVSQEKVRLGLESFAEGGVQLRLLILDDGWQSEKTFPSGDRRLTAFAPNAKFSGDLTPTVKMAKEDFGIETFLVWHTLYGYWGGVDGDSLPGYGVRAVARNFSAGILHYLPDFNNWWGGIVGVVAPEHIYRFFQDYHRTLRLQGVDGVKVDSQCTLEGVAAGFGGRVDLMRCYHEAVEGAAQTHFQGNLINCMSCANEMIYSALNSNLIRTSTDFWPNRPESHGLHLYTNAQVSLWFGEFCCVDWDMFQSGHPMGAYHAAARAVGGCPVYVSDKPDAHDFALLRKLALPDGTILRADDIGCPTRDCLFHDPMAEPVLLKIFNRNHDAGSGILGVFNARYDEAGTEPITGKIRPSDVEGLPGERFAVYAHNARETREMALTDAWALTLPQLAFEVFTMVPIEAGFAPIGLPEMFNSAGTIVYYDFVEPDVCEVNLRCGGRFLAWSDRPPIRITVNDVESAFTYDPAAHLLELQLPETPCLLNIFW